VTPLLETKLHGPAARPEWIDRPELVRYLAGLRAKLVLVVAPAGYGKTTLAAQWRSSVADSRRFAWISLDPGDNDPVRLWSYIVRALQRACPELPGEEMLRSLRVRVPDIIGALIPVLVNELTAISAPVVLILDDYHVISEPSCHDQLDFLLAHLPLSIQIVLLARADPPLLLGRLRATGDLAEIRAPELRFTPEQAVALVHRLSAVRLNDRDLADLAERAEGWPAGLYLAALALRGQESPEAFVREFAGTNRYIADYLAEEVVSRQPEPIRRFLTRTAILGRFTASLCDAVTGSDNARKIISALERENLFVVPMDADRQWFRYHHLFAQLLLAQLMQAEPDIVPTLHKRASAWHRVHGSSNEAIDHAVAAGDFANAADLVARRWHEYADAGRVATVRGWLRSFGDDMIAAHPVAAHVAAWVAAVSGERESVWRWLAVVDAGEYEGPLPDGIRSLTSSAALLRGTFGFEGIPAMRDSATMAVELEDDPASPWYALARSALGAALYFAGEFDAAAVVLQQALLSQASSTMARMMAFEFGALVAIERGRTSQAADLGQAALEIADSDPRLSEAPQSSLAYAAVGMVHASRGQFEAARSELERALRSRRQWSGLSSWTTLEILLRLASVLQDLGDRSAAAALLSEAADLLASLPDGAEGQQALLERLERQLTDPAPAGPLAAVLTQRERGVARLLQGGLSQPEIAQELSVSLNTVKTHTRAIYRKLGVSSRQEAVARGRGLGIL
jgi:LuxR family maltose regulon positive regulatory protein